MDKFLSALLIVAGIIHLLPISGLLGAERLAALYGVPFSEPNLLILMRHRAVLFGLLGALLVWAAFRPALQSAAILGGLVSVLSFLLLAWLTPGYNAALRKVVIADWVALACLAVAILLWLLRRPGSTG
ncbi:phosphopantetheine adenylyltransferase [Pseudomonas sp. BN414]|uniref:phosphopantetheine adenylyltransferase n=1 Tax=Pseudomonas sp. BN414 TaxID=2567888 RepID=UPI0024577DA8|nr:phosphopantetheine adenylyltransferase [Pseudomonas sp. BN414]MDH4566005.1 phosphopantetheine adenylyltransferase [Pseudomonas sp. BN414]